MTHPAKALASYYQKHNIMSSQMIEYMEYSLHSILNEGAKIVIYTVLFSILGTVQLFGFTLLLLLPIRWCSGGVHARTFWGCFFASLIMFLFLIYLSPLLPSPTSSALIVLWIMSIGALPHIPYTPAFRPITKHRTICILRCFYIIAMSIWLVIFEIAALPETYVSIGFYTLLFQTAQLWIPKKGDKIK